MNFLPVPKIYSWTPQLSAEYSTNKSTLITSGCSFTASTTQDQCAASWPGFVKDRCGFKYCVDMSYPGAGNRYIKDSIIYAVNSVENTSDLMIIVMWSGLDRHEKLIVGDKKDPVLDNISYQRAELLPEKQFCIDESAQYILELAEYLESRNILYAFTSYINLSDPPYIPVRDTTPRLTESKNKSIIEAVKNKIVFPESGVDFLYDWAFLNNFLDSGDNYHPPVEANLQWTDQIMLPNLYKLGLIKNYESRTKSNH